MTRQRAVGVVGASARAAVHSLARAGLAAWAVDLFGDRDLARIAELCCLSRRLLPRRDPRAGGALPPGPILYTGGLENHPRVIAELAAARELWGNPPDVLARVRDPLVLSSVLAGKAIARARVLPPGEPCPAQGRWLLKARRSSAGMGVRQSRPGEVPTARNTCRSSCRAPRCRRFSLPNSRKWILFGVCRTTHRNDLAPRGGIQVCGEHWANSCLR